MTDLILRDAALEVVAIMDCSPGARIAAEHRIDALPAVDAVPVDWMLQRMNETASGAGLNVDLNNALFTVGVEWERWKKEQEAR